MRRCIIGEDWDLFRDFLGYIIDGFGSAMFVVLDKLFVVMHLERDHRLQFLFCWGRDKAGLDIVQAKDGQFMVQF